MKEELCIGTFLAKQFGESVFVIALGKHPAAGYKVRLRDTPIAVFPPEFELVHTPPRGTSAQVETEFVVYKYFPAKNKIERVVVHDANGEHEIKVEQLSELITMCEGATDAFSAAERQDETQSQEYFTSVCSEGETTEAVREKILEEEIVSADVLDSDFAASEVIAEAEVFIQAGHLNTPDGKTGASGPLGREIDWTPIVTNEAVRILRAAGISVIKEDASIKVTNKKYRVHTAVFIHFDGTNPPGRAKASVGYKGSSDKPAADAWKQLYSKYWGFGFMNDNYTNNLSGYYGYSYTITSDAEILLELGDLTNRQQAEWLKPRLRWLGALVAHFLCVRLGKNNIPDPGPFS